MAGHTAIITACAHEAALVRRRLHVQQQAIGPAGLVWQGVMHQQEVVLLQCGMGPERAAQAVLWLGQHYQLTGVLSVGFAGALQAELRPGDALLVTHILAQDDMARTARPAAGSGIRPDARLAHIAAMAVAQAAVVSHTGTLLSTTALAATAALVVGILGGRTPFAARAPAFFTPLEPGSMILWPRIQSITVI